MPNAPETAAETQAAADLLPLLYDELRRLAAQKLSQEPSGHTLQPTALVHEAFVRLTDRSQPQRWNGRAHFFGAAAEAMRRILVERARRKRRLKHGGGRAQEPFEPFDAIVAERDDDLLAVDEALARLAAEEPASAEVVKLRFFVGFTIDETAQAMGISVRTANRHWAYARAWLFDELGRNSLADGAPK